MDEQDGNGKDGYLVEVKHPGVVETHRTHDRGKALEEVQRRITEENLAVAEVNTGRTLLVEKKKETKGAVSQPPETGGEAPYGWPRRGKAFRRVALLGGLLGLMLLAPMFLLLGTGVKIAQDPAFVPAPRAENVAVDLFERPAPSTEPEGETPRLDPVLLAHGIAAMLKAEPVGEGAPDAFPYTVHVSSFRSATRAAAQVTALREQGEAAFSAYVEIPGMGDWFRVFCGNYPSREDAETGRERLRALGIKETSRAKKSVALAVGGPLPVNEALALESRLYAGGFFAYAMPRPLRDSRVKVLVGAFQSESRAKAMQDRLTEAGFQAKAVTR
ncbi:SPOR domain-containing protein [Desulfoluna spongiiphila]|uniref:SPOR domain-containing protein n=1 Tax=Desulfoluna spongiiphila TaxID=419481 RepID=UPI001256B2E5|nr:SPOR domain-containing protein [Desulfoluna spongiiphila]VVS93393.1 consensus disorder prediction [Desulfoluna spongiiphila]